MKQKAYTKTLVALIAFCCLCSACTAKTSKVSERETRDKGNEISTTLPDDDTDRPEIKIEETSSDTETWVSTPADVETENTSSDESEAIALSDKDTDPSAALTPSSDSGKLGTGNLCNGGIATGDGKYVYYITHPSTDRIAIMREDRAAGSTNQVYLTAPKTEVIVDCLCVSGDYIFFRENQDEHETFCIVKASLADGNAEVIANGDIASLTLHNDRLYFADSCNLVSTDLNGEKKTVLYESETDAVPPRIAYCILKDKIYFAEPAAYDREGSFYGKLYSMNLDGTNQSQIPVDADVCNSGIFLTDGERLFFNGISGKEGTAVYSCKLDGSDLMVHDKDAPRSMNFSSGKYFTSTDQELFMKKGGGDYELIDSGNYRWAQIVIVGDDLYYISQDADDPQAPSITMRLPILGGPAETLG